MWLISKEQNRNLGIFEQRWPILVLLIEMLLAMFQDPFLEEEDEASEEGPFSKLE